MPNHEPVKLHRVDGPLLRTPKVVMNNTLMIQQDDSIIFGSPKCPRKRHVERTLSADSVSHSRLLTVAYSPALSGQSSRASSADLRSRTSSLSERSHMSSGSRRYGSTNCNYSDDFDEPSDVDEGHISYCI